MSWYISLINFVLIFPLPVSDIAAEIRQRWSAKTRTSTSSVPCDPSHVVLPLWENPPTKTTTWNFCRRASKALVMAKKPLQVSRYHLFKYVQVGCVLLLCFLPSIFSGLLESLHWEASGFIAVVETLLGSAMRNAVATGFFQTRDPHQTKHPQAKHNLKKQESEIQRGFTTLKCSKHAISINSMQVLISSTLPRTNQPSFDFWTSKKWRCGSVRFNGLTCTTSPSARQGHPRAAKLWSTRLAALHPGARRLAKPGRFSRKLFPISSPRPWRHRLRSQDPIHC